MKKALLIVCGWLLVALGTIGAFFPVIPTTPFLLLAAACFSGASEKAYRFLLSNPFFGSYIRHYKTGQGLSIREKAQALILLWVMLTVGAVAMGKVWAYVVFPLIGLGVTCHLLMIKTARSQTKRLGESEYQPGLSPEEKEL